MEKNKKNLILIISLVVICLIGVCTYCLIVRNNMNKNNKQGSNNNKNDKTEFELKGYYQGYAYVDHSAFDNYDITWGEIIKSRFLSEGKFKDINLPVSISEIKSIVDNEGELYYFLTEDGVLYEYGYFDDDNWVNDSRIAFDFKVDNIGICNGCNGIKGLDDYIYVIKKEGKDYILEWKRDGEELSSELIPIEKYFINGVLDYDLDIDGNNHIGNEKYISNEYKYINDNEALSDPTNGNPIEFDFIVLLTDILAVDSGKDYIIVSKDNKLYYLSHIYSSTDGHKYNLNYVGNIIKYDKGDINGLLYDLSGKISIELENGKNVTIEFEEESVSCGEIQGFVFEMADKTCKLLINSQKLVIYDDNKNKLYQLDELLALRKDNYEESGYYLAKVYNEDTYYILDNNAKIIKKDFVFPLKEGSTYNNDFTDLYKNTYSVENDLIITEYNGKQGIEEITSSKKVIGNTYDKVKLLDSKYFIGYKNGVANLYKLVDNKSVTKNGYDYVLGIYDNMIVVEKDKKIYIKDFNEVDLIDEPIIDETDKGPVDYACCDANYGVWVEQEENGLNIFVAKYYGDDEKKYIYEKKDNKLVLKSIEHKE